MTYADLKNLCLVQVIDSKFQVDHINCKKIQLFEAYGGNAHRNVTFFAFLIKHREVKLISHGNNFTFVKIT